MDIRGRDLTDEQDEVALRSELEDAPLPRFLERPGFNATILKHLVEGAGEVAATRSKAVRRAARERAMATLSVELQRLADLAKLNESVRPKEIELAGQQLKRICTAVDEARLRLDSLRLIMQGK